MSKEFVLIFMIFCHIFDDYKIQAGVLNNLKQKSWWKENASDKLYKYDYIIGLIMHSLSWSFMIMLPIAIYYNFNINIDFVIMFIGNAILHAHVDNLKANKKLINLVVDQSIHILQIIITFIRFCIFGFMI